MADNKFFNNQKIYVESDYENIIVVDPNKVVNADNTVSERLVNHEELVIYANLEAKVIPRTKLAIGSNYDDAVQNLRIGVMDNDSENSVNFLSPKGKEYLDTSWSDQITGKDSLEGGGLNQTKIDVVGSGESRRVERRITNQMDTQLLGIQNITIKINTAYVPEVTIEMVDVQGRVLFEQGENSPYSAFMQMPYPLFTLTIKGYFGKAMKYELMLKDFNARFDSADGNYKITTKYIARTYAILSDVTLQQMYALPHMYKTISNIGSVTTTTQNNQQTSEVVTKKSSKGLDKIYEVFDVYKSKGLIDDDVEPMTINQLVLKLDNFERFVMETYGKEDMTALIDIQSYQNTLTDFKNSLFGRTDKSWYIKYLDVKNVIVLNEENGDKILYRFKKDLSEDQKVEGLADLEARIGLNNKKLNENPTFGTKGKTVIDGKKIETNLVSDVKVNNIKIILDDISEGTIDFRKTYIKQRGVEPNEAELEIFKRGIITNANVQDLIDENFNPQTVDRFDNMFFHFGETYKYKPFSKRTFLGKWGDVSKNFDDKRKIVEDEISKFLSKKIKSSDNGLGFNPTIKNIMAVLCASADAFFRLMDDVHTDAWEQRKNPARITSIIDTQESVNIENKDSVTYVNENGQLNNQSIVYPWPQYLELEVDEKGNQEYVNKYPGDNSVMFKTQGFRHDIWPEVEFVEEYLRGALERRTEQKDTFTQNELKERPYIPINSIEFPFSVKPYLDKTNIKFTYELVERCLLMANLSNYVRNGDYLSELYSVFGDIEIDNIKEAIKDSADLILKFKQIKFNADNIENYLKMFSDNGSWQIYSRDNYVTNDLNVYVNKDYGIYDESYYEGLEVNINKSVEGFTKLDEYVKSTNSNETNIYNGYPFGGLEWVKKNLSNGIGIASIEESNDTTKMYSVSQKNKILVSFDEDDTTMNKRPMTNFSWMFNKVFDEENTIPNTNTNVKLFFNNRDVSKMYLTESFLDYGDLYDTTKNNLTQKQTTSLLNTPYFVNAILKGVEYEKSGSNDAYVGLGYLYLNSLPLSTLKEKFKNNISGVTTEGNYIFATLNKFASIHKLPYFWILKYGSIWHRYKKYKESSVDILNGIWEDFNYLKAYDPISQDETKIYNIFKHDGSPAKYYHKYVGEAQDGNGNPVEFYKLDRGMYPKVANDIYYYFTKKDIFQYYTDDEFSSAAFEKNLKIAKTNNSDTLKNPGFDNNNLFKSLNVTTWYQYFDIKDNTDFDNYEKDSILIVPSCGNVLFRHANLECFRELDGKQTVEFIDNNAVYNGSVRCLWNAPNYGYFDNDKVTKPSPSQYMKHIDNENTNKQSFNVGNIEYSNIEDIFGVFTKDMLDEFETHFLNFCRKPENYNPSLLIGNGQTFEDYVKELYNVEDISELTLNEEELLEIQNKYKNEGNIFTSDERTYTFGLNLFDVMKSIFIVDRPELDNLPQSDVKKIGESQIKKFVNRHKNAYLSSDIILKIGNPAKFNRRVFNSFSNDENFNPVDKIEFGEYVEGTLPTEGGTTTVAQSQAQNPQAWLALKLNVGEYESENVRYEDTGSTITNFFVDFNIEFTKENVETLSEIIKMYVAKKVNNDTYIANSFYNDFNEQLSLQENLKDNILNHIFINLNKDLPYAEVTNVTENISRLDADLGKTEIWETFRLMNDKWVSGQDFKNRTIFEDFLFLDRANRDVGNKIQVDIEKLRQRIKSGLNNATPYSIYSLMGYLYEDNNFVFIPTPVYTNFYGVNDRIKEGQPIPQDIPNDLFGTFMEVDTRESRPRMLAIYIGKPSENVDMKESPTSRRLDDAFDLTRAAANPLIENQFDKTDYANSNKCVGFNVDFGIRNQGIFKGMSIDMAQFKNTAPQFKILEDLGDLSGNQKVAQQSQSLYSFYKSRSYTCNVTSMGNAMIQPTMYFNLRHVPMFTGPYLIINVNHSISNREFMTQFEGVRIPVSALQVPDKLVMSVNSELLKTYQKKIQNEKIKEAEINNNNITADGKQVDNKFNPVGEQQCQNITSYEDKPFVEQVSDVKTFTELKQALYSETVSDYIKMYIFAVAILENGDTNTNTNAISYYNNNLFNIKTNVNHNNLSEYFNNQVCLSRGNYVMSYASFENIYQSIKFMVEKHRNFTNVLNGLIPNSISPTDDGIAFGMTRLYLATWDDNFGYGKTSSEIIVEIQNKNSDSNYSNKFDNLVQKFKYSLNKYNN